MKMITRPTVKERRTAAQHAQDLVTHSIEVSDVITMPVRQVSD